MNRKRLSVISVLLCAVLLCGTMSAAALSPEKPHYVVLGDSIAYGSGLSNPDDAVYGKIVADTNGYAYGNYAIPGSTTKDLLSRIEDEKVSAAVRAADLISISIGGNNFLLGDLPAILYDGIVKEDYARINAIKATFYDDLGAIVDAIRTLNPDAAILLQTIYNPQTGYVGEVYQQGADRLNAAMREYAKAHPGSFLIVEVAESLQDHDRDFAEDKIHPSAAGNEKIARAVLETLVENGLGSQTEPVVAVPGKDLRGTGVLAVTVDCYGIFFHFLSLIRNLFASLSVRGDKYEHPFVSKIVETRGLDNASNSKRLFLNADDSHWWNFLTQLAENGTFDDGSINQYVMQYADADITDLLFCIFCQTSNTPTEVMTFRGDLYGQTEQDGKPVDYSAYKGLSVLYNEQQIDVFAKWIDKCRQVGIRPWLSLRMDDRHGWLDETYNLRGDLFYLARDNGWMIGDEYGEFHYCLDYKVPEVRQIMLDYTREQLLRYDVDGIELDFMRELYCFDYLHEDTDEIVSIMNDYIRETAKIVEEAEAKWGHDILLSARLMRDIDQCREWGFDPETWSREGLVDGITVAQWWFDDNAMPIADWKARCPDVDIWACVDRNVYARDCTPEVVRGFAAQYLTAGADGMYLFNWYGHVGVDEPNRDAVYETCGGGLEKVLTLPRRHIVTWQDMTPEGWEPYAPLPLKVKWRRTASLEVETGYIPAGAAVTVYLGFDRALADDDQITLTVNGRACAPAGKVEDLSRFTDGESTYCRWDATIYQYELTNAADLPNLLTLAFANSGKTLNVTYCEIDVTP